MSDGHKKFISVGVDAHSMTTEDSDYAELDVALPKELLAELDEYRASQGYSSRSAVVAEALQE